MQVIIIQKKDTVLSFHWGKESTLHLLRNLQIPTIANKNEKYCCYNSNVADKNETREKKKKKKCIITLKNASTIFSGIKYNTI
jgi:hypothetical protein